MQLQEQQRLQRVVGRHMQPTSSMSGGDSGYQSLNMFDLDTLDDDIDSDFVVMYDPIG